MLYYSNEARKSHQKRIQELIDVLSTKSMDYLGGYQNVSDIIKYLNDYKNLIEKEIDK